MISKCFITLLLSLAGVWPHLWQGSRPKDDAQETRAGIAGVWRGHSECAFKNSPCRDEVNVYRFSKMEGRENIFSVTASKVVDGKEVVMGSSEWKYDAKKQVVECEKPSIQLTVEADKMEGALKLEDGTVYRRIYLKKDK